MQRQTVHALVWLFVTLLPVGCASNSNGYGSTETEASAISFQQLKGSPDTYRGQSVTFGGEVLTAKRLKDGTRIEVLQLPLTQKGEPAADLTQSEGRFIAMQRQFLDPATIPPGTRLTVTGDVSGTTTLPLDETDYTYPVLEIKSVRVWPRYAEAPNVRYVPYGYYSPYWHPYWRPYPYWYW